ncbi:pseudouridine synthase [Comamonas sp.]|uniref:pseudouridine synthase n=1 Tax=Comamonas sp. TaxID=34028 RepID=UPI003A9468DE
MSSNSPKDSGAPGAGKSSASSDSSSARPVLRAPAKPAPARGAPAGRDAGRGRSSDARGSRDSRDGRDAPRGGDRAERSGGRDFRDNRPQRDERPARTSGFGRPDQGRPARDANRPIREDGERRGGFSQRDGQPRERFERNEHNDRPRSDRAYSDRPRFERPQFDRAERPAEQGERRFGGGDRGFRPYGESSGDRGDRGERPEGRGFGRPDGERRDFRPSGDRPEGRRDDRGFGPRRDDRGDRGDARPEGRGFGRPDGERRDFRPSSDRPEGRRDDRGFGPRRDDRGDRGDARPEGRGFGRPDGERRDFRPSGDRPEGRRDDRGFGPRRDDRGDRGDARPEGRGFGRPDGERRDFRPSGDRPEGRRDDRGFGPRRDDRGDRPARPEGRSFDRGDRKDFRGGSRDDRGGSRGGEPRHIPGSFVSESERRPTTGIRTYRPASDGSDRAIPVKRAEVAVNQDDRPGAIRINKRIADMGMCSRREADEWVENGWVKVNGEVAVMGQNVVPGDRIDVDQKAQDRQDQQVTILLHKPMGYVSGQAEDGHEPAVVLLKPENRWNQDHSKTRFNFSQLKGLAPCGRLDIDSVGLLVMTQDGRVARHIIGEDSEVDKEYLVRVTFGDRDVDVQSVFPADQLALLCHGLELDGEPLKPAKVDWQNPEQLRFVLTEGKKRQIRRMCELVGLRVVGLKRIRIGGVTLGNLPVGQWRYLAPHESF